VDVDWLWVVLVIAVLVGMAWLAYRIEPHWVSKDGERFICNGQRLSAQFVPDGRWREMRGAVMPDGAVLVSQRRRGRRRQRLGARALSGQRGADVTQQSAAGSVGTFWTVTGRAPTSPRRSLITFVLRRRDEAGQMVHLVLRIPTKSRAVATLDRVSVDAPRPASPPDPGTA
jgi:hypothetical protein